MDAIPIKIRTFYLNEIIAVEEDIKSVARQSIEDHELSGHQRFLTERGLAYTYLPEMHYLYISKDSSLAEKAKQLEVGLSCTGLDESRFGYFSNLVRRLGLLFGYPECCISSYLFNWENHLCDKSESGLKEPNHVHKSYVCTKNPEKIPFFVNNLLSPRLIFHFPCSYNCKKSQERAMRLFNNLPDSQKKLTQETLARDLLVWSEDRYIVFASRFNGTEINYNSQSLGISGVPVELSGTLRKGSKLRIAEHSLDILLGQTSFSYPKKPGEDCFMLGFR